MEVCGARQKRPREKLGDKLTKKIWEFREMIETKEGRRQLAYEQRLVKAYGISALQAIKVNLGEIMSGQELQEWIEDHTQLLLKLWNSVLGREDGGLAC